MSSLSSLLLLLLLNEGFFFPFSLSLSYILHDLVHAKLPAAAASLLLNTLSTLYLCAVSHTKDNTGPYHHATRFKDKEDVGGKREK